MRKVECTLLLGVCLGLGLGLGCGSVEKFTDANTGDDIIDADLTPDALQTGTVTVNTRTRSGPDAPAANIDVFVTAPDGTIGDSGRTGADGTLTLDVTANDTVTAVYITATDLDITSFAAVEPGDVLRFGEPDSQGGSPAVPPLTMQLSYPGAAGATSYEVYHVCGSSSPNPSTALFVTMTQRSDCMGTPFSVAYLAYGGSPSALINWGLLPNVPFVAGGTAALATWSAPTTFTATVRNIPPEVIDMNLGVTAIIGGMGTHNLSTEASPPTGSLVVSGRWPTAEQIQTTSFMSRSGQFGPMVLSDIRPGAGTSLEITDPVTLPWAGQAIANPAARRATWITDGEGTYDAQLLFVEWNRVPIVGGPSVRYRWTMFLPPGLTSYDFPAFPPALAMHQPQDTDSIDSVQGGFVDMINDTGYDMLRARGEDGISNLFDSAEPFRVSIYYGSFNRLVGGRWMDRHHATPLRGH